MASISLCMIAKNEEGFIAQAIESVAPLISQIVLVDTGSTDRTVEIASSLGAEVYHVPWRDDFSVPRNVSLQHARGDWILVLDADEVIAREDLASFGKLTADSHRCIEFLQRHYSNDHRLSNFHPCEGEFPKLERKYAGYFESNCVRLFPNHFGLHFRGKVHELVEHSIRDLGIHRVERTEIRIHHYGHTPEVKASKNKGSIYTPLGQAKTKESPRDWKNFFELGVEYNNNGRHLESVDAFIESTLLNPNYVSTWINLGYVQCELARFEDAISSLTRAIKLDPRADEAYCNLGVVYMRTQNYAQAERSFRAAIGINPRYVNAYCNLGTCLALM
ncbi:MAG: glycosyltransferase, partial [Bdellovibrionales bacterium]|nr:glycosyltransferase [Bdellovibrionales bacterium]